MRKLFIISSSFLVVAMIFLVAYNVAFKKESTVKEDVANMVADIKFPAKTAIKPITDEAATGIYLDKENEKIVFYSAVNGKVWQIDFDGEKKKGVSNEELVGLENALWSPDGKKVISIFKYDDQNKNFFFYNYDDKKGAKLNGGVDAISWDNSGNKIIYKYFNADSGEKSINVSNPDGTGWKKIADTDFRDVFVAPIPQTSLISFWNKGKVQEETNLSTVGINGGEVKKIFSGKTGADYKWSANGAKAIVSYVKDASKGIMTTGLININGAYTELGIPTLVSKMEWSLDNKHIYYALPAIPAGATMPDDYKAGKFKSTDTFWKINTETGEKERLIDLENINGAYDASQMFLAPSENTLFFVNRNDGLLYKLSF